MSLMSQQFLIRRTKEETFTYRAGNSDNGGGNYPGSNQLYEGQDGAHN